MKKFEEYVRPLSNEIYLTPELVTEYTGTFESITLIDLNNRDRDGNPTVKTLSQPRITHNSTKSEVLKRAIILVEGDKRYFIAQGTKVTHKTIR